jgi:hypothetical protein
MTDLRCKISAKGTKRWFNDEDELHRLDGPAIEWADRDRSWFINGKLHRLDGPAIEWEDGYKEWWIDGKKQTRHEFDRHPLVVFHSLLTSQCKRK